MANETHKKILDRVADFLQECEDRLDPTDNSWGSSSYGKMDIWVCPNGKSLEARSEQNIKYHNPPKKPWKE